MEENDRVPGARPCGEVKGEVEWFEKAVLVVNLQKKKRGGKGKLGGS